MNSHKTQEKGGKSRRKKERVRVYRLVTKRQPSFDNSQTYSSSLFVHARKAN